MKIIERIFIFIESQKIKVSAFEKQAGLSNGYVKKIIDSPSGEKIEDILKAYPRLNRTWLMTGDGEMLKNSSQYGDISKSTIVGGNVNGNGNKITHYGSEYDACQKEVEHLKAIIDEKDKIIAEKEQRLLEKDNLISEKERMIKLLLKEQGE